MKLLINSDDTNIDLDLRSKVTLVMGDSGTGKSYLVERVDLFLRERNLVNSSNIDLELVNIISLTNKNKDIALIINNSTASIIFIDRFDIVLRRKDYKEVLLAIEHSNSRFVIFSRELFANCGYTDESVAIMSGTEKDIRFKYVFDNGIKGFLECGYSL